MTLTFDTIFIQDADMLQWLSTQCNGGRTFESDYIQLMNDITLPLDVPNNMSAIGVYPDHPFKGTFNGNGMRIINLNIDQMEAPYQGLFGYTQNADLYDLGLVDLNVSGQNDVGGMVAYAENTTISGCYVKGGALSGQSFCGGLVGYQDQGTISGCYNTCEVTGNDNVGGLVGFSSHGTVSNSYVAGEVEAQGEAVGAIIGGADEVLMQYCYFNSELTEQADAIGASDGKGDGESMTSEQMRDPQFVNVLNQELSIAVWKPDYALPINNGFPILQWQNNLGVNEDNAMRVTVYPNPTSGNVRIEASNLHHVSILNAIGQQVYDGSADGDELEFDFSGYEAGVYLIRIETSSGMATKRVVVTR
ncbi:MAG: T9SS type A sorting domain-containing protein [Bacteroidales bacterium]|nr:T9SS type A sorting domain-containing protein [Bacteroidales bacterium]